jgi:hypothetical protein
MTQPPAGPPEPPSTPTAPTQDLQEAASPAPSGVDAAQQPSFVYALGQVQPRFPGLAVEKEFAQAVGRSDTSGLTDRQVMATVLTDHRYLARQMCWVFVIEGLETYLLFARDAADLELLIQAVRADPKGLDIDVVIGTLGPIAPAQACGGLSLPMVLTDQIYSFDRDELISALPRPDDIAADQDAQFRASAAEMFDRIMQLADNAGATDEHRAVNYLAVRYPAVYATAAAEHSRNSSLAAVDVRPSRLSGARVIVDVVFSYAHRQTDVATRYFCRVDVTEEFPFLVTKLTPFFER